ncbi:MAG: addiction module protein [Flavobacteriales bacterium]
MTTVELRSRILELVKVEQNASVLEAIQLLLDRRGDSVSDEEMAELDRRYEEIKSGRLKGNSLDEHLRAVRAAIGR